MLGPAAQYLGKVVGVTFDWKGRSAVGAVLELYQVRRLITVEVTRSIEPLPNVTVGGGGRSSWDR